MTLLPMDSRLVFGAEGPGYKPPSRCANPDCNQQGTQTHELWRRSFLIGDYAWVELPSGRLVRNKVRLCAWCHSAVTVNEVHIRYLEDEDRFYWVDVRSQEGSELEPHPGGSLEVVA